MDDKILKIVYTFFLGLILALFVGLGISTFYQAPQPPNDPFSYPAKEMSAPDDTALIEKQQREYEAYAKKSQEYNRNVSVIALVGAVVLLAVSLAFEKRNTVIANGILLGGVFTLLYSIARGFSSEDNKWTFVAVSVGLLVALYLGYRRFAVTTPAKKKKKR